MKFLISIEAWNILMRIVGITSLIFAIYQWRQRRRLELINRQNTWSLYREASVILGYIQKLEERIKTNTAIAFEFGVLRGLAESMMLNQIRQINLNENITSEKIEEWLRIQKICDPTHKEAFVSYVENSQK